jgi:magnesium chelatase subunit ChlD-like protein
MGRAGAGGRIAWAATLAQGRPHSRAALRWQQGVAPAAPLWLVLVDASASTRRNGSLSQAKGFLQALFDQAYRQRARLALLTASGAGPHWQRHGLKASAALRPWLDRLGAGGGTPLRQALDEARAWLARQRQRLPTQAQRCVVITDGRVKSVHAIDALGCDTLLVDIELGSVRIGKGRQLAQALDARYVHVESLAVP